MFSVSVMLLSGCLTKWEEPYFVVKPSGLNVVNIRQHYTTGRMAGHHVNLRIAGNGTVTITEGASARVANSYANDPKGDNWNDLREHRFTIPEEEAVIVFQKLVNSGLFVKHKFAPENVDSNETAMVYVSAKIQHKTIGAPQPVTDPELLETLKMVVMTFHTPRPMRKTNLN